MPASESTQRARACLFGLAVGDAIGTTVEFSRRGTFAPVTDMVGGGPFDLKPGEWTDDTSMALCLAESLAECGGFDPRDQMERYCRWWREGHLSSNGRCFDIGITVSGALRKFEESGEPFSGSTAPDTAGNGSIMRLAPAPIFANGDLRETIRLSRESSRTTHGAEECLDACHALGVLLHHLLGGMQKEEALEKMKSESVTSPKVRAILEGSYREKPKAEIRASGYVIHTLEAALWSFHRTTSFRDAILTAVNLGEDADTTGAVCGQIAGACYGIEAIPAGWLAKLAKRIMIESLAERLAVRRVCLDTEKTLLRASASETHCSDESRNRHAGTLPRASLGMHPPP
jgi:ADP-ribosyl-[dinitrogen reductase] hydrolase